MRRHLTFTGSLRRHPLVAYFVLAYSITWGGILVQHAANGFALAATTPSAKAITVALMLLGPCTSGIVMTSLLDGRDGVKDLRSRMTRWSVDRRFIAIALVTIPATVFAILWPIGAWVNPAFVPGAKLELLGLGLVAGFFEEIGWTGFATPRMLKRHSVFVAGLTLGAIWAIWHAAADFSGNYAVMGSAWWRWFTVFWLAALPAYRVLMTWVYANTGSLLLAVLMHASYTGWLLVLSPTTSAEQGLVWQSVFAVVLWLMAFAVWRLGDVWRRKNTTSRNAEADTVTDHSAAA